MTQTAAGFQLDTGTPGTLGVRGELSFDTAAAAWQAIRSALAGAPVSQLDLADVRHSDSAGLACVLAIAADAARRGQTLRVVRMPAGMQSLAQVCEVDRLLA
ncbi:STAS domain-containing protein [Rhodanobacter denitrificans]|jgi:phospholipid transport system transporter-binding protein|uniref:STAS domain-containing protein n=1 Tax=Rhodanobacter TaxID=75309 RepID=UPI00026106C1|nr:MULTISPECIES: STAS domain-containing protein [Rhodanobacter]EIM03621.1 putative NTP binding protein (contains STAS domain) [Rhodanobacter denitrificans]UJM91162.1 STAS domain-containing protein [Rhodanobacter denitrificans]